MTYATAVIGLFFYYMVIRGICGLAGFNGRDEE